MVEYLWVALLGILIGEVINYLADVLPVRRRLAQPFCAHCGILLSWPTYLANQPCPRCQARPPMRRWVIPIIGMSASLALWIYPSPHLTYWAWVILVAYLGLVAVIDLEHRLILHPVSLVGAGIGLGLGVWARGWMATLLGGVAGFSIMLALYYFGIFFARWLARRKKLDLDEEALGFGDVILGGVLGLILGWPGVIAGLVFGILVGGAVSLLLLLSGLFTRSYRPFSAIPYAPCLILGSLILLYKI